MSYEIVKSLKVRQAENGNWVADMVTASNNVRPLYYEKWIYGGKGNYTKEQLEKNLLLDFLYGNLQRGSSKYRKVALSAYDYGYLKKYSRIDRIIDGLWNRRYKASESRKKEIGLLQDKLYKMRDNEARESLYRALQDNIKPIKFTIKNKWGQYVIKVNRCTYQKGDKPRVFDNAQLYRRVTHDEWWKENFVVEIVK